MIEPVDHIAGLDALCVRLGIELPAIQASRARSQTVIDQISSLLVGGTASLVSEDANFVVFGSLARGEWTEGSDLDWTYLIDGEANPDHLPITQKIAKILEVAKFVKPGSSGVFGNMAFSHDIIHQIGGTNDTNRNMTQRILLLLESTPLAERVAYDRVVAGILYRYLQEDTSFITAYGKKTKIPRFLLNDIVRFWRTMAVDFASKQRERAGHGWALRNIKLRMSRKLIFASGLLTCFSCLHDPSPTLRSLDVGAGQPIEPLVNHLKRYVNSSPIEILAHSLSVYSIPEAISIKLMVSYDEFLGSLNDPDVRSDLHNLQSSEAEASDLFQKMRSISHEFQNALTDIFFNSNQDLFSLIRNYGVF